MTQDTASRHGRYRVFTPHVLIVAAQDSDGVLSSGEAFRRELVAAAEDIVEPSGYRHQHAPSPKVQRISAPHICRGRALWSWQGFWWLPALRVPARRRF